MKSNRISALILAAGKGTRMNSDLAKVLHTLNGRPMLAYVVDVALKNGCEPVVVIVGHQAAKVEAAFAGQGLMFVEQAPQLGTGHAVMQAACVYNAYDGTILILCGDVPLLSHETLRSLVDHHHRERADVTVMTVVLDDPAHYGRVIKNAAGEVQRIVEARDATESEKRVCEINTGIYCVEAPWLFTAVSGIRDANAQKEYYLTDIIEISLKAGRRAVSFVANDPMEVMGINTPDELHRAALYLDRSGKARE